MKIDLKQPILDKNDRLAADNRALFKEKGVFQASEAIILNKVDTMEVFNFNEQAFRDAVTQLNPAAPIFPISATKGAGVDEWADWLRAKIEAFRA